MKPTSTCSPVHDTRHLLGTRISTLPFTETVKTIAAWAAAREPRYICTLNVHMLVEAQDSPGLAAVLEHSDLVTLDGMPLVMALRMKYGVRPERVAGMDLVPALIAEAARQQIPVYFYGSTAEVLQHVVERAKADHPALPVAGSYAPPFRALTAEEDQAVIRRINDSGAGIVFVALGCPKQEHWMADHRGKIRSVMIGVGGALPVYAGLQSRAPRWMQRCALEWLYRLYQEPRRLFRRYLITNSRFMLLLFKELLSRSR